MQKPPDMQMHTRRFIAFEAYKRKQTRLYP